MNNCCSFYLLLDRCSSMVKAYCELKIIPVINITKEFGMSECCSKSNCTDSFSKKHVCPLNGKQYNVVSPETIKHHIKSPWMWRPKNQGYYFCSDPDCPVVYFGQDGSVIEVGSVRNKVGIKSLSSNALVCYCYGITREDIQDEPRIREFVIQEKKSGNCSCKARNPSGKCCLADFPKKAGR